LVDRAPAAGLVSLLGDDVLCHSCLLTPLLLLLLLLPLALMSQDGGDPDVAVSPRDIVYTLDAAAAAGDSSLQPSQLASTDLRCGGVSWCDGEPALGIARSLLADGQSVSTPR